MDAEIELAQVQQQIADASRVLMDLENSLGAIRVAGGDVAPANEAVSAAFQAVAVLTRRRAALLRILGR